MKLNCDLGESFGVWQMGADEVVMPWIDQANIACGFHASDPVTMSRTVRLALEHNVELGAHPSYPDLVGFGRRSLDCSPEEVAALIQYQVGALQGITMAQGGTLSYVKPHGALYNDMQTNETLFKAVVSGVGKLGQGLKLMTLAGPQSEYYQELAATQGVELIFEAFADRRYSKTGQLVSRAMQGAVLDSQQTLEQVRLLKKQQQVKTDADSYLSIQADSLCVHGDNEAAIQQIKAIREVLS